MPSRTRAFRKPRLLRIVATAAVAVLVLGTAYLATDRLVSANPESAPLVALTADEQTASTALGAPLPRLTWTPAGVVRSALTVDPEESFGALRMTRFVHQSFSRSLENVALLTINRGVLGRVGGGELVGPSGAGATIPEAQRLTIGDIQALVETKRLPDGSELVTYYAERNGLVLQFSVTLAQGLDRTAADRMFASIR